MILIFSDRGCDKIFARDEKYNTLFWAEHLKDRKSTSEASLYQACLLNRREFCKSASWAALGILSTNTFSGIACKRGTKNSPRVGDSGNEEFGMANEILSVEAKVINQKGSCALGHKVGDVVKFTEYGVEGQICIHALYSMLPAVFAMLFDASSGTATAGSKMLMMLTSAVSVGLTKGEFTITTSIYFITPQKSSSKKSHCM